MKHSLDEIKRISGHDVETSFEIIEFHNDLQSAVAANVEFIESIRNLKRKLNAQSLSEAHDAIAQMRLMQQAAYDCYNHFQNFETIKKPFGDLCRNIGEKLMQAESTYTSLAVLYADHYRFCGVIK